MAKCMAREGLVEKPEMDETIQTLREEIHTIGRRFDAESHMINTALCSKHEELLAAIQRVKAASITREEAFRAREEAAIAREEAAIAREEAREKAAIASEEAREKAAIAREKARDEDRDRAAIARETLAFKIVEKVQQLEQIFSAHHLDLAERLERNRIEEALRSKEGFEEAKERAPRPACRQYACAAQEPGSLMRVILGVRIFNE